MWSPCGGILVIVDLYFVCYLVRDFVMLFIRLHAHAPIEESKIEENEFLGKVG